jgi:hypothetical protein
MRVLVVSRSLDDTKYDLTAQSRVVFYFREFYFLFDYHEQRWDFVLFL